MLASHSSIHVVQELDEAAIPCMAALLQRLAGSSKITKFSEGTFKEVYTFCSTVLQVWPFGQPDVMVNGEPQCDADQVWQEVAVQKHLSELASPTHACGMTDGAVLHAFGRTVAEECHFHCEMRLRSHACIGGLPDSIAFVLYA